MLDTPTLLDIPELPTDAELLTPEGQEKLATYNRALRQQINWREITEAQESHHGFDDNGFVYRDTPELVVHDDHHKKHHRLSQFAEAAAMMLDYAGRATVSAASSVIAEFKTAADFVVNRATQIAAAVVPVVEDFINQAYQATQPIVQPVLNGLANILPRQPSQDGQTPSNSLLARAAP